VRIVAALDETARNQNPQRIEYRFSHGLWRFGIGFHETDNRLGRGQSEPAGEHSQSAKALLGHRIEQVITPGDGIAHGAQAGRLVVGTTGQQPQAPGETGQKR
jgi:hypothetical protein